MRCLRTSPGTNGLFDGSRLRLISQQFQRLKQMISTRDLTRLPAPNTLRDLMQALAMLDAILEEEWDSRYYSFNSKWSADEQMGSMRNGCGDDLMTVFDAAGCFLRGFDHESPMSPWLATPTQVWPGVLDDLPKQFDGSLNEPAFHMEDTTFCIWRLAGDAVWSRGDIAFPDSEQCPDGSEWMLSCYDGQPETYQEYARNYFELDVPLETIARIYAREPLTPALLAAFASSRSLDDIRADAEEIGYPIA